VNEIKNKYNPKKIIVDDYQIAYKELIKYEPLLYTNVNIFDIVQPLWYSFHKSIQLKNEYETDNGFKYDYVIKLRPDIFPTSAKTLIETAQGSKEPITEKNFTPEELAALQKLIASTNERGDVQYPDYYNLMTNVNVEELLQKYFKTFDENK
jgi:hypothetical protein